MARAELGIVATFKDMASQQVRRLTGEVWMLSRVANSGAKGISKYDAVISGMMAGGMLTAVAVGIAEIAKSGIQLNKTLVEVRNNTTMTEQEFRSFAGGVVDLQAKLGASAEELAMGYMHAFNVMDDVTKSQAVLGIATQSAIANNADLEQTTNILANVIHAYGLDLYKAADASESFAKMTQIATKYMGIMDRAAAMGNMTVEQFNAAAGRAIATGANLRIPIEQVAAAFTALTKHGFTAAQAGTQMVNVMTRIANPTAVALKEIKRVTKATGVDLVKAFSASYLAANGLTNSSKTGVFDLILKAYRKMGLSTAEATQETYKLINAQRGGLGLAVLLGTGAKDYAAALGMLSDQAYVTGTNQDQFNSMMEQTSYQMQLASMRVEAISNVLSQGMEPAIKGVFKALNPLLYGLYTWIKENKDLVGTLLLAAGAIAGVAGALMTLGATALLMSPIFRASGYAIAAVGGMLSGPMIAAIALALVAITLLSRAWSTDWRGIRNTVGTAAKAITGSLDSIRKALEGPIQKAVESVGAAFTEMGRLAESGLDTAGGALDSFGKSLQEVFGRSIWENASKLGMLLTDTFGPDVGELFARGFIDAAGAIDNVKRAIAPVVDYVKALSGSFNGFLRSVKKVASIAVKLLKGDFSGAIVEIYDLMDGAFDTQTIDNFIRTLWKFGNVIGSVVSGAQKVLGLLAEAWREVGRGVAYGLSNVLTLARDIGRAFAGLFSTGDVAGFLDGVYEAVGRFIEETVAGIARLGENVAKALPQIAGTITTWLQSQVAAIDWQRTWEAVKGFAKGLVAGIAASASATVAGLTNWLRTQVQNIQWTKVWQGAKGIGTAIATALPQIATELETWLRDSVGNIDWDATWEWAKGIGQGFLNGVGSIATEIGVWLGQEFGVIDWAETWRWATGVGEGFVKGIGSIVADVQNWLRDQWASIDWGKTWRAIKGFATGLASALGSAVGPLTKWLKAQIAKIDWTKTWAAVKGVGEGLVAALPAVKAEIERWIGEQIAKIDWAATWKWAVGVGQGFLAGVGSIATEIALWIGREFGVIDWAETWKWAKGIGAGFIAGVDSIVAEVTRWVREQFAKIEWGKVWDAAKNAGAYLIQKLGVIKDKVIGWLQTNMPKAEDWGKIWEAAKGAGQALINSALLVAKDIQDWIAAKMPKSSAEWAGIWASVSGAGAALIASSVLAAKDVADWIGARFQEAKAQVEAKLISVFGGLDWGSILFGGSGEAVNPDQLATSVVPKGLVPRIVETLSGVFTQVASQLGPILQQAFAGVNLGEFLFGKEVQIDASGTKVVEGGLLNQIKGKAAQIQGALAAEFSKIDWGVVWGTVEKVLGGLWEKVKAIGTEVQGKLEAEWAKIKWTDVWNAAGSFLTGLWEKIQGIYQLVTGWLSTEWSQINWTDIWAASKQKFEEGLKALTEGLTFEVGVVLKTMNPEDFQNLQSAIATVNAIAADLAAAGDWISTAWGKVSDVIAKVDGFLRENAAAMAVWVGATEGLKIVAGIATSVALLGIGFRAVMAAAAPLLPIFAFIAKIIAALVNPVGLVLIAIAGFAMGLKYAYENIEPFRKSVDDFAKTLSDLWNGVLQFLAPYFEQLGKSWSESMAKIGPSVDQFNKDMAKIAETLQPLITLISTEVPKLATAIGGVLGIIAGVLLGTIGFVVGWLVDAFVRILPGAFDVVAGAVKGIFSAFALLGNLFASIYYFLESIGKTATGDIEGAREASDRFKESVSAMWENIKQGWEAVDQVFRGLGGILEGLKQSFNDMVSVMSKQLVELFPWLPEIGTKLDEAKKSIEGMISVNIEGWAKTFEGTGQTILGIGQTIWGVGGMVADSIGIILTNIANLFYPVEGFNEKMTLWAQMLEANFQTIVKGVENIKAGVEKALAGLYDLFIRPFVDAYNFLVGHSLIPDLVKDVTTFIDGMLKPITDTVNSIKDAIVKPFEAAKTAAVTAAESLRDSVLGAFNTIKEKASGPIDAVKGFIDGMVTKINAAITKIGDLIRDLANIKMPPALQTIIDKLTDAANKAGMIFGGGGKGNAAGTSYWKGGGTWVGERGPEWVNLPRGSQVRSNTQSRAMSREQPASITTYSLTQHVQAPVPTPIQGFAALQAWARAGA